MITKRTLSKIRKGNYKALIDAIETLLDLYDEDKYDLGYKSFLDDIDVHAERLTQKLFSAAGKIDDFYLDEDQTKEIIKNYFINL